MHGDLMKCKFIWLNVTFFQVMNAGTARDVYGRTVMVVEETVSVPETDNGFHV